MPKEMRLYLISGILGITLVFALILVYNVISAQPSSEETAYIPQQQPLSSDALPVEGWYTCVDLDVGPVPGRVNPRHRFILCHPDGWELKTFCMNPNLPNPVLGAQCTRIGPRTYWCGSGIQPLKEYFEPPPPTPNFTATYTPTPTATNTVTPTPTPTPTVTPTATKRPPSGGPGFRDILDQSVFPAHATPTSTPFGPVQPSPTPTSTPFSPVQPSPTAAIPSHPAATPSLSIQTTPNTAGQTDEFAESAANFFGIDFNNQGERVRFKIIPPDKKVNNGKPIWISVFPRQHCEFGDDTACINIYTNGENGQTIFLSIHSGIGGEAQAFRHAMEGTGFDTAGLPLRQIKKNVNALEGAAVVIYQGDTVVGGFTLIGTSRIPAKYTREYFDLPIPDALNLAAEIDESLQPFIAPDQYQIVFETCGWRAPGEKWFPGLKNTQSSVYIGVIQIRP